MKKISGSGAALTEPFVVGGRARNARKGQPEGRFGRTAAGGGSAALGWRAANNAAAGRGWGGTYLCLQCNRWATVWAWFG